MGFLKNVKAMKDAMRAGYDGSGPSEEALASLTPEQRAAYDEQMAKVAAAQTQAVEAQASARAMVADSVGKRPLRGAAGEFVYGSETQGVMLSEEQIASMSSAELMAWQTQQSKDQFKDLLKNPVGGKKAPPPPMAPVGPADPNSCRPVPGPRPHQPRLAARRPRARRRMGHRPCGARGPVARPGTAGGRMVRRWAPLGRPAYRCALDRRRGVGAGLPRIDRRGTGALPRNRSVVGDPQHRGW
jgi:hypothetical protein